MANSVKKIAKILMCRPTYFDVKYSINPWMNTLERVNRSKAVGQWETLRTTLERLGAEVVVMEPEGADQYPDLVFTANAAVIRDKTAYVANFFYPERKGEPYFYNKWFKQHGYSTCTNKDVPFEGAGDALWAGAGKSKLFCGVGPRTDVRALELVTTLLGGAAAGHKNTFKAYGVRLIDPRFYHIDTCFCPLSDELAIYYPGAFDALSRHNLANELELVAIGEDDAARFACNAVVVGRHVVMHQGSEHTANLLEKLGYDTHFLDMSEFLKSGGSAKCCTLAL